MIPCDPLHQDPSTKKIIYKLISNKKTSAYTFLLGNIFCRISPLYIVDFRILHAVWSLLSLNIEDSPNQIIYDISGSGVFIKTSQTFSLGQTILMAFMSPDNLKPFRINGEILRTHDDGIGVTFKIESQVQEAALKSLVDMMQSGWESAHHVSINEDYLTISVFCWWRR